MRFCEEELLELAKLPPDLDGLLQFKTQASRIRDQIQGYKSRWFKLKGNFLFYYRINDEGTVRELLGALLMERFRIILEVKPNYAFSISFQNDRERKYIFVASSSPECQRWVHFLKNASYEKLQTQFFLLQQRLVRITGKNPVQRHGLQRYYVDFLCEDGIELNDDDEIEIKQENIHTKNSKEIKANTRHPLTVIQENRFQQEQSDTSPNNHQEEKICYDLGNELVVQNNETITEFCGDACELNDIIVEGQRDGIAICKKQDEMSEIKESDNDESNTDDELTQEKSNLTYIENKVI